MPIIHKILLTIVLLSLISSVLLAQVNSIYEKMSLDELLNIDVVVTASKHPEDLFETPLSVTIIKKEEINKSGVTSIPEALRLAPGLIVREITPGNYDIQIRGYDEITKNVYVPLPYNTTALVMIDNRIVYSYFSGGTFWEAFPIDINDIERIEVVRGPASALYGPNAVTGVINIITSQANKQGMNIFANGSLGTNQAKNTSLNIGYNWSNKTKLSVSGNFTERHRYNDEYFDRSKDEYVLMDDLAMTLIAVKDESTNEIWTFDEFQEKLGAWYNTNLSLKKMGGNIFLYHRFSEQSNMDVAMGIQNSQSQKSDFINFATPLSQINSKSYYLNSRIKLKNLIGQVDIYSGQDLSNYNFNSYKFTNIDANLEYYKQFNQLSIRPGISYKHSAYNNPFTYDEPFSLTTLNYQFKDEPKIMSSYSSSLLSEWKPNQRLRIIGAIRMDKFNINKYYSFNHEIGLTYRLNKNNLFRFVYSKANRSPFIFDTYINANFKLNKKIYSEDNQGPLDAPMNVNILSQEDLKFPTIKNNEVCWRTKLSPGLSLDLELFFSTVQNFIVTDVYREIQIIQQMDQFNKLDSIQSISGTGNIRFENFDLKAHQYGFSFALDYAIENTFKARLFGTWQNTKIKGRTEIEFITSKLDIGEIKEDGTMTLKMSSFTNPTQWSQNLTPSFFGGLYLNYKQGDNWNFNTNAYVYTEQEFVYYDTNNIVSDYTGEYNYKSMIIEPNMVLNAKVSYSINKNLTTYFTIKNILGNHREFGYADQIGSLFLIGIQWEF